MRGGWRLGSCRKEEQGVLEVLLSLLGRGHCALNPEWEMQRVHKASCIGSLLCSSVAQILLVSVQRALEESHNVKGACSPEMPAERLEIRQFTCFMLLFASIFMYSIPRGMSPMFDYSERTSRMMPRRVLRSVP